MLLDLVFHSQVSPFHAAVFLDHFRQRFIGEVDATAIVLELEHRGIISNGDQAKISRNEDATQQAQLLHACLKKTCDTKALTDVCDIIATVKGNPKMKSFGEDMKTEWEKGMCSHSECPCICDASAEGNCGHNVECSLKRFSLNYMHSCSVTQTSSSQNPSTAP